MEVGVQKILVTAGNTVAPIDKVRAITNIFHGRTGAAIAHYLAELGHEVTLLTSAKDVEQGKLAKLSYYRTFDELLDSMRELIEPGGFDTVIHSAAVSDYRPTDTFHLLEMTDLGDGKFQLVVEKLDSSGKVGSNYDALLLMMEPTQKIIDLIREPWGFSGKLVKFKLQVGIGDNELLEIARRSRLSSGADLIVANCLEWVNRRAYIVGEEQEEQVTRTELPAALARRLGL
jgi:phosphopantothenate-cysteine ligase/phosphopantothenoylcysteine decarboxylase/phosphopantothenate--cysteine ligase